MKIVNTGIMYRIYDESLKTFDSLPTGTYKLCFNKMTGFFLEKSPDIVINEKIYGIHETKVNKIMSSFKDFERNLGVILSGDKGIGKSICAKLIAKKSLVEGLPVIICNEYVPGIAEYIGSIEQEVVVIFDEFDKTFTCGGNDDRDSGDCQAEMLTLFDGMTPGKKLFVVTCNKLSKLNEFLVNRPGRFHYHLRFEYPTADEIKEYLQDKLSKKYWNQIQNVVSFASRVDINYDCLRAISFELENGLSFNDAIKDLNIVNTDNGQEAYTAHLVFTDGTKMTCKKVYMDFYDDDDEEQWLSFVDVEQHLRVDIAFDASENKYDIERGMTIIDSKFIRVRNYNDNYGLVDCEDEDCDEEEICEKEPVEETIKKSPRKKIAYLAFKRKSTRSIHYVV